jgi:hypothetical protein
MRKSHSEHFSAVPQNKRGLSEGGSQKKLIWLFSRASGRILLSRISAASLISWSRCRLAAKRSSLQRPFNAARYYNEV